MEYSSVLVTFPTCICAKEICRSAVESKLAACANIFSIKSVYRWNGKIQEEAEAAAVFKIKTEDFQEFRRYICSVHPYEVPCIVRYDIAEGHLPYLDWIRESTDRYQETR